MKVLISTMPYIGHFNPTQPIATELVRRGHEVVWLTGPAFEAKVAATGARFERMAPDAAVDWATIKPDPGARGLAGMVSVLRKLMTDRIPAQVRDYQRVLEKFPADVMLVEWCTWGVHTLHDLTGQPYVTLGINPLVTPDPEIPLWGTGTQPARSCVGQAANSVLHWLARVLLHSKMNVLVNEKRKELGLGPLPPGVEFNTGHFSKFAHIMATTPAFEFPRKNLTPNIQFVGSLLPAVDEASFVPPPWWSELLAHPQEKVVHITQGTVATDLESLVKPTVRALASRNDLLLVVTGKNVDQVFGPKFPAPANVRAAAFIPHALLLPHVGVMVTNAGYQGVLTALRFGVPMVCAGRSEDKADTSARVAWAGAGIDLRTDKPTEGAIRAATYALIENRKYRDAAVRVRDDFAKHNGPAEAADIMERVAAEGKIAQWAA